MPLIGPSRASPPAYRSPRGPIEVDWSHPINKDLQFWWPGDAGGGRIVHDLAMAADATFNAAMDTPSWAKVEQDTWAVAFDATADDKLQVVDQDNLSMAAASTTFAFWFEAGSWVTSDGFVGKFTTVSANREWGVWTSSTTNGLQFFRYDVGFVGSNVLANAAFYDGTPTFVAARTNPSATDGTIEVIAWKPSLGLLTGTPVAVGTSPWRTAGPGNLAIGAYQDDGTGNEFACNWWNGRKWNRALDNDELRNIAEEPWLGVAEIAQKSWFLPAAAGGGRIMSSLAGAGGLVGSGGIAGKGGGLAA